MPYLMKTVEGPKLSQEAQAHPPFGPGFQSESIAKATMMEVWGSSFSDEGDDFCRFILKDATGNIVESREVPGY